MKYNVTLQDERWHVCVVVLSNRQGETQGETETYFASENTSGERDCTLGPLKKPRNLTLNLRQVWD